MSTTPIADYALLSDRHSAALVSRDGSVDWLCFPRFDSPSLFARLLGEGAGHWSIRATGTEQVTRRYLDRTMVLETTCRTPTGIVVLVDALAMGEGNKGHELGRDAPHLLLRQARCTEGEVEMELEYAPRPEYGLIYPLLEVVDGGLTAIGGADVLVLSGPVALAMDRSSASGRLRLRRGEDAGIERCERASNEWTSPRDIDLALRDDPGPAAGQEVCVRRYVSGGMWRVCA